MSIFSFKSAHATTAANVNERSLWISDAEVHAIFANHRCYYTENNGVTVREATGQFVRYQRSNEGTMGYVFKNPLNGQNKLWVISKKTRKPFALAIVK